MARQEEGWPLGLQPLNVRVNGLFRNHDIFGSFNSLLSGSPTSSTDSSSDLDTESTGSFFHDKSITLGSLMGVSRIVDLPRRRSTRGMRSEVSGGHKAGFRSRAWCFSLCPTDSTDAESTANNNNSNSSNNGNPPSLGHFLAVERRAANENRRNHINLLYGPDDEIALAQPESAPNSLFVDGRVAPPCSSPWLGSDGERRPHGNGCGVPVLFSCVCGQAI
ncbi:uncharacterized protein At3g17950-like [Diospyros lotus]|uniref:uncharacterized protein At3g17950-like n=1 Tax=Diospyros lotus TaxID=55363 RepID=UPI00225720D9|nr:uncharacterized protein At3g17950-like [Diospyros lotus]